jgi:hypothetical protein
MHLKELLDVADGEDQGNKAFVAEPLKMAQQACGPDEYTGVSCYASPSERFNIRAGHIGLLRPFRGGQAETLNPKDWRH